MPSCVSDVAHAGDETYGVDCWQTASYGSPSLLTATISPPAASCGAQTVEPRIRYVYAAGEATQHATCPQPCGQVGLDECLVRDLGSSSWWHTLGLTIDVASSEEWLPAGVPFTPELTPSSVASLQGRVVHVIAVLYEQWRDVAFSFVCLQRVLIDTSGPVIADLGQVVTCPTRCDDPLTCLTPMSAGELAASGASGDACFWSQPVAAWPGLAQEVVPQEAVHHYLASFSVLPVEFLDSFQDEESGIESVQVTAKRSICGRFLTPGSVCGGYETIPYSTATLHAGEQTHVTLPLTVEWASQLNGPLADGDLLTLQAVATNRAGLSTASYHRPWILIDSSAPLGPERLTPCSEPQMPAQPARVLLWQSTSVDVRTCWPQAERYDDPESRVLRLEWFLYEVLQSETGVPFGMEYLSTPPMWRNFQPQKLALRESGTLLPTRQEADLSGWSGIVLTEQDRLQSPLQHGHVYRLKVRARNRAGLLSPLRISHAIGIDTTPPSVVHAIVAACAWVGTYQDGCDTCSASHPCPRHSLAHGRHCPHGGSALTTT